MKIDTTTIVIAAIALLAVWLVFSLVRKAFGLLLLAAVGVAAYVLWSNPDLLEALKRWAADLLGG